MYIIHLVAFIYPTLQSNLDNICKHGIMRCTGQGFDTCVWGKWVYRDCGINTKCKDYETFITCASHQKHYLPENPQQLSEQTPHLPEQTRHEQTHHLPEQTLQTQSDSFHPFNNDELADLTYHLYTSNFPLTSVACSDGVNGLITRWKYINLQELFPYVTAASFASWNSVRCGECIEISKNQRSIYVTVIDKCQSLSSNTHFDLSNEAFIELLGEDGIFKGSDIGNWKRVDNYYCNGNLG